MDATMRPAWQDEHGLIDIPRLQGKIWGRGAGQGLCYKRAKALKRKSQEGGYGF